MNSKQLFFPIKWGIIYSLSTVILYLYGVWVYPSVNRFLLVIFLFFFNMAMLLGFAFGTHSKINFSLRLKSPTKNTEKPNGEILVWKIYNICFWSILILTVPRFIIHTGFYSGINLTTLIQRILYSISNVSQAYFDSHTSGNSATGIWKTINFFCVLGSGFIWCYTPVTIALWKKIKLSHKFVAVIYWLIYCLQYILSATNSGIVGQIFYIFVSIVFVSVYRHGNSQLSSEEKKKNNLKLALIAFSSAALILFIFGFAMKSRVGANYKDKLIGISRIVYNEDSFFNRIIPEVFHPTLAVADSYLTQGYYALEMSLSLPWKPTFGLGNSRFLMSNFFEISGINFFNSTYQMRLYETTGWHYDIYWHTAYLWLANDVSLVFLPVLLFFLFAYFGMGWKSFIVNKNFVGLLVIVLFAQFMFYISANNNLFSYSETLLAFILVFVLFLNSSQYNWEHFDI